MNLLGKVELLVVSGMLHTMVHRVPGDKCKQKVLNDIYVCCLPLNSFEEGRQVNTTNECLSINIKMLTILMKIY